MVLRITQQLQQMAQLRQIQERQQALFLDQKQISSGVRFDRPSEDPFGINLTVNLSSAISLQERFAKNAQTAKDFTFQQDNELNSATEVMNRARELAIRAANEALNEQQIQGLSGETNGLIEHLADIANAVHEDRYVFGGYQTHQPPFLIERDLTLEGTALAELNLNQGSFATRLETQSLTTLQAGAFSLNGGDIIINGVDMGSFTANDATRSAQDNAQALVDLINAKTQETGVQAQAITFPNGSFAAPGAGPFEGIALVNLNENNQPSHQGISIRGKGFPGANNLPVLRNENLGLNDTRFTSLRLGAGAIGDVPAGTVTINGITLNTPMTFNAANTPEQNAQVVATAINSIATQTGVRASTDGYGFVQLISEASFEIAGAPPQINLPNQRYAQTYNAAASNGAVSAGTALTLGPGSLQIGGVDIFHEPVTLGATLTPQQRANAVANAINGKSNITGIRAETDAAGQLVFSNGNHRITAVTYRGDAGDNAAQLGRSEFMPMVLSGDEAFAGNLNTVQILSTQNIPAAGLGSGTSTAPVSFLAGDSIAAGELVINGTNIVVPGPLTGVPATDANTVITAINAQTGTTGVSAQSDGSNGITLNSDTGAVFTVATAGNGTRTNLPNGDFLNAISAGQVFLNGVDLGAIGPVPYNAANPPQTAIDTANALRDAINAQTANTGVQAQTQTTATGGTRLLLSATGEDIAFTINTGAGGPNPTAIFNSFGIQPGTVVDQKLDSFEVLIKMRNKVDNTRFNRSEIQNLSEITIREIDEALDAMVAGRVELGVRGQRAELIDTRSQATIEQLKAQRSNVQDVDLTEAISQLTLDETALQAALAVTSRISGLSLLNFI